ncbi:phosphoribosyltransferase [Cyanobacteria bacterium FACHB-471]|nr:phosphoribosyltransferase [Cyanobacteria bacterium FACHB-471]
MPPIPLFRDRQEAGEKLAQAVLQEVEQLDLLLPMRAIVYALPRGGLPVAAPVARSLNCPLDVVIAKKVTRPENPELAIGAVTADGHIIRSRQGAFIQPLGGSWRLALQEAQAKAREQLEQFTDSRPQIDPKGAIAVLVDDGIATGMTMAVAARALRAKRPAKILICAPVAPLELVSLLKHWGDRVIVLAAPETFLSVSRFYAEFPQVEMEEALACLVQQNEG